MAIERYSTGWTDPRGIYGKQDQDDWQMLSGTDPERWCRYFTVRMLFDDAGVLREIQSVEPTMRVPKELLEQKVALLKVAPVGMRVDGVGLRKAENLFYLRIYEDDLDLGERK